MAYDYALVHLKFTIPLAGFLTLILKPILTRLDLYKTFTLIVIAFSATIPWDSYLIRTGVWTYPPDAIVGPRLFQIPAEELFFFVIQTYITCIIYILLNKPILHAQYLTNKSDSTPRARIARTIGQVLLVASIILGGWLVQKGGEGTYMGLILAWACPFALLTWSFSGYFIAKLPTKTVVLPIVLPTVYLWVVDELALGRGTWAIKSGTKIGWCIFGSLEIEEAVFFLATNVLIVFGMVAFDRGLAVLNTFPEAFPGVQPSGTPSSMTLARAVLKNPATYDMDRVRGIREAVCTLRRKSRSFYLASAVFPGPLRIDLVLLYSFCRVADDLVDDAQSKAEALNWITKMTDYLDLVYASNEKPPTDAMVQDYVRQNFPSPTWSAFTLLPTHLMPSGPLYGLLEGFKMDLDFQSSSPTSPGIFPIVDEATLQLYAHRVASTVGELCLHLAFHHHATKLPANQVAALIESAHTMGHALQYVNIARDIRVDADINRVYLPATWLSDVSCSPEMILREEKGRDTSVPPSTRVQALRERLLRVAFEKYAEARPAMGLLQPEFKGPMIVAVESYMEIGRVLREQQQKQQQQQQQQKQQQKRPALTTTLSEAELAAAKKHRRATVPKSRRLWVAWKNLLVQ